MPYIDKIRYDRTGSPAGTSSVSAPIPTYQANNMARLGWGTNSVTINAETDELFGTTFRVTGLNEHLALLVPNTSLAYADTYVESYYASADNENINISIANCHPSNNRASGTGFAFGDMLHLKKALFKMSIS